jgi:hypothetical protein
MRPVQFLHDPRTADTSGLSGPGILVLYRAGLQVPEITGARYVEFEAFKKSYESIAAEHIVFVGLSRMINPQNRCDFIFSYLTTMTPNIPKTSIDVIPFVGEPWRMFWHYQFTRSGAWLETHSYAVETTWKKWFYREREDWSGSAGNVRMLLGKETTRCDLECLRSQFVFESPDNQSLRWYDELKQHVFGSHQTPKMWIASLMKECNKRFRLKFSYDSYLENRIFELPALPVYRFVSEENTRRQDIYNAVVLHGTEK